MHYVRSDLGSRTFTIRGEDVCVLQYTCSSQSNVLTDSPFDLAVKAAIKPLRRNAYIYILIDIYIYIFIYLYIYIKNH